MEYKYVANSQTVKWETTATNRSGLYYQLRCYKFILNPHLSYICVSQFCENESSSDLPATVLDWGTNAVERHLLWEKVMNWN